MSFRAHDILRRNAARFPGKIAVIEQSGRRITWRSLSDRAGRLSAALDRLGVRAGDRVSLISPNRIECVEAFFACAALGAIHAPLNFRARPDALAAMIVDAGARVLLAHADLAEAVMALRDRAPALETVVGFGGPHAFEHDYEALIEGEHGPAPAADIDEDSPCWIAYTGGTTGPSKGVVLTHRNLLTNTINLILADRIRSDDVYMITGSLFHIVLNMGLAYWFAGATVVIQDFTPDTCLDLMQSAGVTKVVPVASMLSLLVDAQARRPRDLRALVQIGLGGGAIAPDLVRAARAVFHCDFVQTFGQTEASHHFASLSVDDYRRGLAPDASAKERERLLSAGRPQPLCEVRIVDEADREVALGEVGEIVTRGDNVMKGYWNRPELTAKALRGGWLHTGDLGRVDEGGYIHVVDRREHTVVSGGRPVYTLEVERALYQHPGILECVVMGKPALDLGAVPRAVVVPRSGVTLRPEEMIAFCRGRLQPWQVPVEVEIRAAMPRAATGKIDRLELARGREASAVN
jgi:long-chain acyl-CoA synthetase